MSTIEQKLEEAKELENIQLQENIKSKVENPINRQKVIDFFQLLKTWFITFFNRLKEKKNSVS
jgi:hypothetical protein